MRISDWSSDVCSSDLDRDVVRYRAAAHVETSAKLGAGKLHFSGIPGKLASRHDVHRYAGCTNRMALGLQPARQIDGQPPAPYSLTFPSKMACFAGFAQAHGIKRQQIGDRKGNGGASRREN